MVGVLLLLHQRRPLEIVPVTWVGKGQLIYVMFLWLMVTGNLDRAIPGFSSGRMVTEWILFMNAILATFLVVTLPGSARWATTNEPRGAPHGRQVPWPSLAKTWLLGVAAASLLVGVYGSATLAMYQEHIEGKPSANHRRFGPDAKWRIDPILRHGEHP
jgi:hypothetical protein